MHKPIFFKKISLYFPNKVCFENFSCQIYPGSPIGVIGRNGSGKSSLLNILRRTLDPSMGEVLFPDEICIGYVEQVIQGLDDLSGGQRFNKRLSEVLAQAPDVLLLDEPTNHLDRDNRQSLMGMLRRYPGTLIVVSHDVELLRTCTNVLWHIDNNQIHEFSGYYDDYVREIKQTRLAIEKELASLKHERKDAHASLMKEQKRAAKSRAQGQKNMRQKKWSKVVGVAKACAAEHTFGKKTSAIDKKKQGLSQRLDGLRVPEIIVPKFSLTSDYLESSNILSIHGASVGYDSHPSVLHTINLSLTGREHIAICGKNASGKSTLLKAIFGHEHVVKTGSWVVPHLEHIGYLDQHYSNLDMRKSVISHVQEVRPEWQEQEIRRHLNDFLFRKNEEVSQLVEHLSGGERARASLSVIAAKTPRLLLLDEITNNLDLETREHVIQVLKQYPGAMIIVSHDSDFLNNVGVDKEIDIEKFKL